MNPGAGAEASVVTVGMFDGVHLGHRAVLDALTARARRAGLPSVVVTFEPHPLEVVNPARAPGRLTTAIERMEVLASSGVDHVLVMAFDHALSQLAPAAFVEQVLRVRCGMKELVVGHDHGLGHDRSGGVRVLQELGRSGGFPVEVVEPVALEGMAVSSSVIRREVVAGRTEMAARLLGRPYRITAQVGSGARRGRELGFPTANLMAPPRKLLPPDGVYAVVAETPAGRFGGMMNQGHRPTFDDGRRLLEVHLFGFEGDLYDQWLRVEWVAPLREIRRFDGVTALRHQLELDRIRAMAALATVHLDLDAPISAPE